uniref:Zona pellucida sperm-binding protein 3 receptor n=1 Tax=Sciurus vulgaris TaxID=55149 RepID=A0A8D2JRT0_SCIVU
VGRCGQSERIKKFSSILLWFGQMITYSGRDIYNFLCDCGLPPKLPFASPLNQLYETNFKAGTVLKYTCHSGYRKVNSSRLTCGAYGAWIYSIFCIKKQCRNPGELTNGKVDVMTDFLFGSTIHFSCSKGYILIGSTSSQCEVQGSEVEWSDSLPECPQIPQGIFISGFKPFYTHKDSIVISCKKGYILRGSNLIHCEAHNEWYPSVPTCEPNGCSDLPEIPGAFWEKNAYAQKNQELFEIGTKLKYQCKPGYHPTDELTVTCQQNLIWTSSKGCERMCCPTPNLERIKIVREKRDFTSVCAYASGDFIFYMCEEGYYPASPDGKSSCQEDGTWKPQMPECKPGKNFEGTYYFPDPSNDPILDYLCGCDENAVRNMDSKILCPKPVIENGRLAREKDHYVALENITVQCDFGYSVVGPQSITCSVNKTWQPEVPKCKKEVPQGCEQVIIGGKLMQCLPNPEEVKMALEVYKLSLEIERLEQEKDKCIKLRENIFEKEKSEEISKWTLFCN